MYKCTKVEATGHLYQETDKVNVQWFSTKTANLFKKDQVLNVVDNLEQPQDTKKRALSDYLTFSCIYSELSSAALLWEENKLKME